MKRRSFFQRVIGGFAAIVGFGQARTINPLAPPNAAIAFDPKAFEHAMAPLDSTYGNVYVRAMAREAEVIARALPAKTPWRV